MTSLIEKQWADQGLALSGILIDLRKDLRKMSDKGINPQVIAEREHLINDLVDFYTATDRIIKSSCSIIEHLNLHRTITYRVLDKASKCTDPNTALSICQTFTNQHRDT